MRDSEITKFLVSFSGQIECVVFPAGVFDSKLYIEYATVWGPDWDPVSGLTSGTTQMAQPGNDPERVVFNMPLEMVFSSTNVSGWPQLVLTVRSQNPITGDALRGYALVLLPPTTGPRSVTASLVRPKATTMLGDWLAWLTGRHPELADPKMLAHGRENYLLRTESYGTVTLQLSMVSKDLRKLGYDNQPPSHPSEQKCLYTDCDRRLPDVKRYRRPWKSKTSATLQMRCRPLGKGKGNGKDKRDGKSFRLPN